MNKSVAAFFTTFFLAYLLSLPTLIHATTTENAHHTLINENIKKTSSRMSSQDKQTKTTQYIVQFEDAPAVKFKRDLNTKARFAKSAMSTSDITDSVNKHKNALFAKHQKFEQKITEKGKNSHIKKRYSTLLNAVGVETELDLATLKNMSGVKQVYPVKRYKAKLANLLPIIKADDAWQLLGGRENAGQGIKIAIIDSGIIPEHPMFDDTNMTTPNSNELPSDDYCQEEPSFCNNKLIVARHYLPSFINVNSEGEYNSPRALSGHGVHVAGIATGRQVTADNGDVISGVAPGAYLMVYKGLWGQDGTGSDFELYSAIEDAYEDGADIINNSWGGETGGAPNNTIYQDIYELLESEGVVVVSAAGNEGEDILGNPVESSISCPACVEAGISVGATTTDLVYGLPISYDNQVIYAQPSDNYSINSSINGVAELAPSSNSLGCSAWGANALDGKIAIVNRGDCFFENQANLAEAAGAIGLIVINNVIEANIAMSMGGANLPSLLISQSDGATLTAYLEQAPNTQLELAVNTVLSSETARQDAIASFSSLGPNGDSSFIKPDISAPGVSILSSTSDEDESSVNQDYVRLNGTSMASPVVAGAAALLKQDQPNLNALQIKNILINSSDAVVTNSSENRDATPFETGAGRLNVLNALNASAYAQSPNMVKQYCVFTCTINNQLTSISNSSQVWQASIEFDNTNVSAHVSPSEITLASQQAANFEVSINVSNDLETDWYFGRLIWTNNDGDTVNQAIAINNETQVSSLLTAEITSQTSTKKELSLESVNSSDNQEVNITLNLYGGAEFDDNTVDITTSGSYQINQQTTNSIDITATLDIGNTQFISATAPIEVDLATENVTAQTCSDSCDEVLHGYDFNFRHYGIAYSSFFMSENGYIVAGNNVSEDANLFINESLPNDSTPNNMIAPFWADFDLEDSSLLNDTGGGEMYVAEYKSSNATYLILQWNNAKLYTSGNATPNELGISHANVEFTFQLILQENSERKWFRYLDIPEQPYFYTVGIENELGTLGSTYWFDGNGTSEVNTNDSLQLNFTSPGELALTEHIVQVSNAEFAIDDEYTITEGVTSEFNVLNNDLASSDKSIIHITVNDIEQVQDVFADSTNVALDKSSLVITSPPSSGVATIIGDGIISYLAHSNFSDQDSFTYQIENTLGQSSTATVRITEASHTFVEVEPDDDNEDESDNDNGSSLNWQWLMLLLIFVRIKRKQII